MIIVIVQAEPEFVDLLRKNVNSFYLDDHLPLSADPGDEEFFIHQQLRYECIKQRLSLALHFIHVYFSALFPL